MSGECCVQSMENTWKICTELQYTLALSLYLGSDQKPLRTSQVVDRKLFGLAIHSCFLINLRKKPSPVYKTNRKHSVLNYLRAYIIKHLAVENYGKWRYSSIILGLGTRWR